LMLWTQTAMMLLALVLAVLTSLHRINVAEILLISFLAGVASALNYPAYQSLYPDLVNRGDLVNAVALNSAQFNMSRAIGPTLAGLALGTLGAAACFYLNAVSFLALIIALLVIVIPRREIQKGPSFWAAVLDGFRHYRQKPFLLILLTVPAYLSFLGLPFIVLMPVYARDLIKVGASGLGYLMAGAGIGAVISALVLAARSKEKQRRAGYIFTSASIFSLALILLAHAHSFWWAFLLLIVVGATMVGSLTLTNMTLQMSSPPELRGRIMSVFFLAMSGLLPFGNLAAGAVAQSLGTRFALTWAGAICLIYFLTLLILLPRLRLAGKLPSLAGQN
jgi:MFS family permease